MSSADKAAHLIDQVDLDRPQLADVRAAANPAEAFAAHLSRRPRPRYRFEYDRKPNVLAFLNEHYAAWRDFDLTAARRFVDTPTPDLLTNRGTQDIPALGQAWWVTGDPAFGAAFERIFLETKTGDAFLWGSFDGSQPVAELIAWFLLDDCPGITPAGRVAFLDHLITITHRAWDDCTSQWAQLGLGPEGHNWYIHGMHCLPLVGLLFPEFKRTDFFRNVGWSVVEEHLRGHYMDDGGARETTLGYHAGTMNCLWDLYVIAKRNDWPMSDGFVDRLIEATLFVLKLAAPNGALPSFGDTQPQPGMLVNIAAVAAALTGDPVCKGYAELMRTTRLDTPDEAPDQIPYGPFWYVGLEGAATYARTRAAPVNRASVMMPHTGYAALRDGIEPEAHYLAIAAAERGPIVTSHGHNEIAAIEVHAAGVKFLGEMGCAGYGESPARDYDQTTAAHNTLTIDGQEQVPILNEWRWSHHLRPAIRRWISLDTHDFIHVVHEGFYHFDDHQTIHARKVLFIKRGSHGPGYWLVLDWVESNVPRDYQINFHGCVPAELSDGRIILTPAAAPGRTREQTTTQLAVVPPTGDQMQCRRVDDDDGLAAYIEYKGLVAEHYPCFTYARRAESHCFAWVLMPCEGTADIPQVERLPVAVNSIDEPAAGATALRITGHGFTDLICVSHKDFDGTLAFADVESFGHLAFRRRTADGAAALAFDHTMADGITGR
ncbi:MAG: hypothetical protein CMJ49_05630 [Planctomycetaceae bacterium]|nr:hypothetical protein [Planctomycetaceae bacterium]